MDFDFLTGPLSAWELSCVEMVDNVRIHTVWLNLCTFPSYDGLSNVKMNYESIGGVVFQDTRTHLLLREHFQTLTCKDAY